MRFLTAESITQFFIVAKQNVDQLKEYFNTWENKVKFHVFTVMIEDEKILDQIKGKGDVPE